MRIKPLRLALVCLAAAGISQGVYADESKPTCDEAPERRDCVKVEDPDAEPPNPSTTHPPKVFALGRAICFAFPMMTRS